MDKLTPIERMKKLREELKIASDNYYNGIETMSNFEYDMKFDELKILEEQYGKDGENFTNTVGAEVNVGNVPLKKVTHEYEAKSLGKTKSVDDLIKEQSKTVDGSEGYTCLSWKLDGCTVQLTYEKGKLTLASTRGDGRVGQDITENSKFIEGIPQTIPTPLDKLVVRGEALMSYAEFDRVNANGQFANPRNLASATITALDKNLLKDRKINFMAFELVDGRVNDEIQLEGKFSNRLNWLETQGFGVVPHEIVKISDLKGKIAEWSTPEKINALGFPVDGLVVAYDNLERTKDLQGTEHHPSLTKSMAFKWQDETVKTTLRDIEWSPSRTGLLNPVAIFDTVDLCGTKVSRASLHNVSYIEGMNLKVGDNITVYKANMIIPQIAENLDRDKGLAVLGDISCPCCKNKAKIENNNGTKTLVCENEKCLAKELGTFTHFVEKHGMNIEGLSEKSMLILMENGIITDLADLFTLSEKDRNAFTSIEGLGDKAFDNLLVSIENAKKTDTEHFLYACGIEGISKGQIKEIVGYLKDNYDTKLSNYHSPDGSYDLIGTLMFMQENHFDFTQINGIGTVLAKNLSDFIEKEFVTPYEMSMSGKFSDCLPYLTFTDTPKDLNKDLPLSNKTFVITGSLNGYTNRDEMVAYIESLGGKVSSSVSKNTDYLINNDVTSTSGKNKKAQDLGIPIISEEDFTKMVSDKEKDEVEEDMER